MEKKDLLKKQELAEELGMKFEEATELFSEETLETMKMVNVVGGSEDESNSNCEGANCVERCGCSVNNNKKCSCTRDHCGIICSDKSGTKCDKCEQTTEPEPGSETTTSPGGEIFPDMARTF